jgi:Spy/CpxP family protein refolding chaperone
MHPGFHAWWKHAKRGPWGREEGGERAANCGPEGRGFEGGPGHGPGPGSGWGPWAHGFGGHGPGGGFGRGRGGPPWANEGDDAGFGVRRPLRFLAWKLELEEAQVAELAIVLDELKTERAQAAVDQRRTTAALAESVAGASFDEDKAKAAANDRLNSTERTQIAVTTALRKIHAVLDEEQRKKLSYLLRTGQLSI